MIKESQYNPITLEELISALEKTLRQNDHKVITSELESLRSRVQHPAYSERLSHIINAFAIPNSVGGTVVKDPISGKPYPNSKKILQDFINELKGHQKMSSSKFNLQKFAQETTEKKKKKRGNPFRVLMGKVGKFLDHGLSKREIVRTLLKENIWDEKMIANAVDIVKDYNKKKKNKPENTKIAQTLMFEAPDWIQLSPDYNKRSTPELVTALTWLTSLDKMKEVDDRSNVKSKIRAIKEALLKRGATQEYIEELLK